VNFAKTHLNFVKKIEGRIQQMIDNGKTSLNIHILPNPKKVTVIKIYISRHYHMSLQLYLFGKNPFLTIIKENYSIIPKILLSNYTKKIIKGDIPKHNKPFDGTIRFSNWSHLNSIEHIEKTLKRVQGKYYIEKVPQRTLLIHFWDMSDLEKGLK
jgi:hypothetical protein